MSNKKMLSTSALAKKLGVASQELFAKFNRDKLIFRDNDGKWQLTTMGVKIGGEYAESSKYGRYIRWPETIAAAPTVEKQAAARATAKALGDPFGLTPNKVNFMLSELGWIEKSLKGWKLTKQGEKVGGMQDEDRRSGVPFVRWPESILKHRAFLDSIKEVKGEAEQMPEPSAQTSTGQQNFREKFEAKHRTTDGHYVRSKAEMLIDNWLYMAEIIHAYERKLPVEENVYCDFYIPTGKVYIEYWGYENDSKYLHRKKKKIEIYEKYDFNLIQLQDADVQNLDDILPRLLLKFGVQSY
jgi:hypothetical protein